MNRFLSSLFVFYALLVLSKQSEGLRMRTEFQEKSTTNNLKQKLQKDSKIWGYR